MQLTIVPAATGGPPRAAYAEQMPDTIWGVSLGALTTALSGTVLSPVRIPDPEVVLRGVVVHTSGDPVPDPDLLVLCAAPEHTPTGVAAVAVRQSALAPALARLPAQTALFTAPDPARWSDVYDQVQLALRDSWGELATDNAFDLADRLASALGGAVAIEDRDRRVVAFSTIPGQPIDDVRRRGILGRHVPEHVERTAWYSTLWREREVCEFPAGAETTARLAIAVRAGAEPLGSIWVVGTRETLSPDADEVLRRATAPVAACLTQQDHLASRSRRTRGQLMRQLLAGEAGAGLPAGDPLPGGSVLVGVRLAAPAGDGELLAARLADALSLHAQRFQGSVGLAAAVEERVYALLPTDDRHRLDPLLRSCLGRIAPTTGWVAVGPPLADVDELARARRQVDRLLSLRDRRQAPTGTVTHVEDMRDELALAALADASADLLELRHGAVHAIASYDRQHGTSYVGTLRAWFEACGDVKEAAADLHVHPNTFRYRLTRAAELFGVRLDAADDRLLLHLQVRLADFW